MSTRNRKRVAGNNIAVVGGDDVAEGRIKKTTRGRRAVKIEFETDANEEKIVQREENEEAVSKESSENVKSEVSEAVASESLESAPTTPTKKKRSKPVDTMGCERTADLSVEPKVKTVKYSEVSNIGFSNALMSAMERLKGRGLTVQSMLDINEDELAGILTPVGFYKRKATYIKKTAKILRDTYADDIPATVDDLMSFPGVGPKMAYICMNAAWKENVGIGVDTHVHRIANRLKWTGTKETSDPEKTRAALESWMPKDLWQEINIMLVGFGQEICLPIGPKCASCLNKDICPSSTAKTKKKSA